MYFCMRKKDIMNYSDFGRQASGDWRDDCMNYETEICLSFVDFGCGVYCSACKGYGIGPAKYGRIFSDGQHPVQFADLCTGK